MKGQDDRTDQDELGQERIPKVEESDMPRDC